MNMSMKVISPKQELFSDKDLILIIPVRKQLTVNKLKIKNK